MKFNKIKILKGGSLCSTEIVEDSDGKRWLSKTISTQGNREYGLVRFMSQLKRHQVIASLIPNNVPRLDRVIESDGVITAIYDYIPDAINVAERLVSERWSSSEISFYSEKIYSLLSHLHGLGRKSNVPKNMLSVYIRLECIEPLQFVKRELMSRSIDSGCDYNLIHLIESLERYFKIKSCQYSSRHVSASMLHGNSTLENILIQPSTGNIFLVDFYDETYFDCDLCDFSQVLQCSCLHYGYYMSLRPSQIFVKPSGFVLEQLNIFNNKFTELLRSNINYNPDFLNLLLASQFSRLLPFRLAAGDYNRAILFLKNLHSFLNL
jgi:hypothetical protein